MSVLAIFITLAIAGGGFIGGAKAIGLLFLTLTVFCLLSTAFDGNLILVLLLLLVAVFYPILAELLLCGPGFLFLSIFDLVPNESGRLIWLLASPLAWILFLGLIGTHIYVTPRSLPATFLIIVLVLVASGLHSLLGGLESTIDEKLRQFPTQIRINAIEPEVGVAELRLPQPAED